MEGFTLIRRSLETLMLCVILTACAAHIPHPQDSKILGQNDEFVVIVASKEETYTRLASRFLEDEKESWRIEEANNNVQLIAGMEVVVPKTDFNRIGVYSNGYQVIPIIAYHRFGKGRGRLSVSREQFIQQMEFLKQHGYQAIPLQDLVDFLHAEKAIPRRSVVLTIDDGYKSTYEIAFPILSKYGFPATIFIYSDYIGKGGLNWRQMKEMEASGLITFQAHSKTHANLTKRSKIEPIKQYQNRLNDEVRIPENLLGKRMTSKVFSFAYPFGKVNRMVVDELRKEGYELGATVHRGANPFFVNPYLLRRTMIYGAGGMAEFEQALQTFEPKTLR
jgi:peptidoglycan/xylan/chitin deacetylase (PgdA/CDA1 family)